MSAAEPSRLAERAVALRLRALALTGLTAIALIGASGTGAAGIARAADSVAPIGGQAPIRLPAAAVTDLPRVAVRQMPDVSARKLGSVRQFRYDHRPSVFLLTSWTTDPSGAEWYRVDLPGRPNGRSGWARALDLEPLYSVADTKLVVDRGRRRLRLLREGRVVLRAPVGVGSPDAPTPVGRFYVTARFRPTNSFLGRFAFETSGYASISDWPRGGVVGLHGTSAPETVGTRASHGCLRIRNKVALRLKRFVALGTRIVIRR